jgi:DNA cross-link repair 1A protein
MSTKSSTKPLTPRPSSKSNVPSLGRQSGKKPAAAKISGKPNASILNFFQKVDSPLKDDSIFLTQGSQSQNVPSRPRSPTSELDGDVDDLYGDNDDFGVGRFNEDSGPVKRRKTSNGSIPNDVGRNKHEDIPADVKISTSTEHACSPPPPSGTGIRKPKKSKRPGPFLSDSDTDDEIDLTLVGRNRDAQMSAVRIAKQELDATVLAQPQKMNQLVHTKSIEQTAIAENNPVVPQLDTVEPLGGVGSRSSKRIPGGDAQAKLEALQPRRRSSSTPAIEEPPQGSGKNAEALPVVPLLKKEETSMDEWAKFDDVEEFPAEMDEFGDGEEFVERKWMEEQAQIEADENREEFTKWGRFGNDETSGTAPDESMAATCPICNSSLNGVTPDLATRHVNSCLDGNPEPLPELVVSTPVKESKEVKYIPPEGSNRFARKAAIARPGQANPFEIGAVSAAPSSAFSKLMSGHAEDTAWANAAAAEHTSRGRPAYERTCPFYKIMPGFFICVDAFRYGAVQGCNAYFLSHFHSDHYVGLTSTWCHGPIYCSKVTANLVKQQLRVDPKWVISLNFEERFEVSGTQGVAVTMIPANHCPGSSLFLFEKVIGRGKTPKIQRVLHCGDFRACPAHLAHPLLMPDIVDSINGQTKQQKIDVCYLDTTYLNPRYAFPSQENVITACADMCVNLRKERAEESDAWEVVKRERAGAGMNKFVNAAIKADDDSIAMSIGSKKPRGRLLVVCGTYSIGKERICMGIARALDCKIWAPPGKMRICAALEDPELMSRMTDDPKEAQIHMQMLMELRAETLQEYLNSYKPHFSRIVGFRPSGWNYRPPNSRLAPYILCHWVRANNNRFTDSPSVSTILHSSNWQSSFSMADLVPQRGSTKEASCFGVPYSEHSSFRELTMFICALRVEKIVPTVNVGSAATRAKMKNWIEKWQAERRKHGCITIGKKEGQVRW